MINNISYINWYGAKTLYIREIKRFLKVYHQTLIAPVVSALIFLSVFVLALGNQATEIHGIKFINFMGYGLIIMTMMQSSFTNTSSSLIMSKVIGYINDILMPPFSGFEIVLAYTGGAITRGIIIGLIVGISLMPFVDFLPHSYILLIYYSFLTCFILGLLGIISAIFTNTFDKNSAISSYIITPLSFLSGTFYSIDKLPASIRALNDFNPFYYMIDGFRYSLTGYTHGSILYGTVILTILSILLFFTTVKLFDSGWRLKE